MAAPSRGYICGPEKTLNPEWRQDISILTRSSVIFRSERSNLSTLCRKILAHDDGSSLETACVAEAGIGGKNVAVRIESQKITECLDGNHRTWHGILPRSHTF